MDYVFLNDEGDGLSEVVKSAIEPLGKSIWLTRDRSFSEQMEESLKDHDGSPVVVVIDIGAEKISCWDGPLGSAIKNRFIGGNELPSDSSIIVLSESSQKDVFKNSPENMGVIGRFVNCKRKDYLESLKVFTNITDIKEEDLTKTITSVVTTLVSRMSEEREATRQKTLIFNAESKNTKGLVEPPVKTEKTSRFSLSRLKDAVVSTLGK